MKKKRIIRVNECIEKVKELKDLILDSDLSVDEMDWVMHILSGTHRRAMDQTGLILGRQR
jgi:hypothetical protein